MLKISRRECLIVGLIACLARPAIAANRRQYYSSWTFSSTAGYYFASYFFRLTVSATNYSYHYAIYYESRPRYIYYFNPYTKRYWGRYDLEAAAKDPQTAYSLLKEDDRREKLTDIPEEAFPKPAAMPQVPDAEDDLQMEPPPNPPKKDLPEGK